MGTAYVVSFYCNYSRERRYLYCILWMWMIHICFTAMGYACCERRRFDAVIVLMSMMSEYMV